MTALLSCPRVVKRKEIADAGLSAKSAAHAFDQDFDPIPGSNKPSNEAFQTLEWAFSNPDALSRLEPLSDLHNFIRTGAASDFLY